MGEPTLGRTRFSPRTTENLEFDHMKFQPERAEDAHVITRQEPGRFWVDGQAHEGHLVVPWQGDIRPWTVTGFEDLDESAFAALLAHGPELVIFGSGGRLRFPPAAWTRALIDARVGIETMDTAAACRTYNVLASERRRVVAALLAT
jgi:uncharacterized protein